MADPAATQQFNTLAAQLRQYGLGELFRVDSSGNPSGWLWDQIQAGVDTSEELQFAIEQTDVYRDRFAVITAQQENAAKGGAGHVMSPAEVIRYEEEVKQMMSAAGLPSTFYDDPKDFHQLILNDMAPTEVRDRITQAFDYVLSAPPEVRQAFEEFYGVGEGDAQLAAWALDPDRTVRDIGKATRTAYTAGMAERFDVEIDRKAAESIADLPMTERGIVEGMEQVAAMENVFTEGLGDSGTDLTDMTGVNAVFNADAGASAAIQRRIKRRQAIGRSASGGAVLTQEGVVGVGSS